MTSWWVLIASGPSMRRQDADALRFVGKNSIAINCAVFFTPWVGNLYAVDAIWWRMYGQKTRWFRGERYSMFKQHTGIRVNQWRPQGWARTGGNSGHQAVQLAVSLGAKRIALLGYDHQHTEGRKHCHPDHPETGPIRMGNAKNVHHWVQQMNRTALELKNREIEVINLSRETALKCFPRVSVEQFVAEYGP